MKKKNTSPVSSPAVRFFALGGLGEVGMNCAILECGDDILLLDCGVNFPEGDHYGIDVLIPDFTWLYENVERIVGLVVTHGHMDHIGAVAWLLRDLDIPVYAPPFALALIRHALEEQGLAETSELVRITAGQTLRLGCFGLEFIHVNHSIPDCLALAIDTPVGRFVHTGDFKVDHTPINERPIDLARFAALGAQGVRALFSDSTNAEQPGVAGSESRARDGLASVVRAAPGRVFVTMFSTNTFRLQSLVHIAEETGRKLLLLGRSLQKNSEIARDCGHLHIRSADLFVDLADANSVPRSRLLVACTGSQGEARAALTRLSLNDYPQLGIDTDDVVVFSARTIPGNEREIYQLQDRLVRRGARIVTNRDVTVHVSGHACQEEQKLILQLVQPREFVPVHGDHRFLRKHAAMAQAMGIQRTHVLDNGNVLEFRADETVLVEHHATRKVWIDGGGQTGDLEGSTLRDRRKLARQGLLIVWMAVDAGTRSLAGVPEILARGVMEQDDFAELLLNDLRTATIDAYQDLRGEARVERREIANTVRQALNRIIRKELRTRPVIEVLVHLL